MRTSFVSLPILNHVEKDPGSKKIFQSQASLPPIKANVDDLENQLVHLLADIYQKYPQETYSYYSILVGDLRYNLPTRVLNRSPTLKLIIDCSKRYDRSSDYFNLLASFQEGTESSISLPSIDSNSFRHIVNYMLSKSLKKSTGTHSISFADVFKLLDCCFYLDLESLFFRYLQLLIKALPGMFIRGSSLRLLHRAHGLSEIWIR